MNKSEKSANPIRHTIEVSDLNGIHAGLAGPMHPDVVRSGVRPESAPAESMSEVMASGTGTEDWGHLPAVHIWVNASEAGQDALKRQPLELPPRLLAVGLDFSPSPVWCQNFRVTEAVGEEDALRNLGQEEVAVLLLGPRLTPLVSHRIVSRAHAEFPGNSTVNIVLGAGSEALIFQDCIDEDRIFYIARGALEERQLYAVVKAAYERFRRNCERASGTWDYRVGAADDLLEFCARLSSQTDLSNAGGLLAEAVRTLVHAEASDWFIYDADKEILWSKHAITGAERGESAASGLTGYVARTGERVLIETVGVDPRYDADADNPGGNDTGRFIAEPIFGFGGEGGVAVIGVVTAVRNSGTPPFSTVESRVIERLASYAGSVMSVCLQQNQIQARLLERTRASHNLAEIYRQEAVDYNSRGTEGEGNLLQTAPRWLRNTHWIAVLVLLICLIYGSFARLNEYAAGPFIIRARRLITIPSTSAGIVQSVGVSAGDPVGKGDLLVTFRDSQADSVRAPETGVVADVRVRSGQRVAPGEEIASVIDEEAGYESIVLVPGSYAPQIRAGMPIDLKLQGYVDSHEVARIGRVGGEVISARDAARYTGADALMVSGPVVVVRARLQSAEFTVAGHAYNYRDGMTGTATITVRSSSLILSLLPGLKAMLGR